MTQIPVPVFPTGDGSTPVAGQPYTLDCIVNTPDLTNSDITWRDPDNNDITDTSGRVTVGDVVQDGNGNSVRTLFFDPLSTDDSGAYLCNTPSGDGIQTLTVDGMSSTAAT